MTRYGTLAAALAVMTALAACGGGGEGNPGAPVNGGNPDGRPHGSEPEREVTTPARYYEMCSSYLNGNRTPAECENLPPALRDRWNDCIDLLRTMHAAAGHTRSDFFVLHYLFLASQYAAVKAHYDEAAIDSLALTGAPVALPVDHARQAFIGSLDDYFDAGDQPSKHAAIAFFGDDTCLDPVVTDP